MFSFIVNMLNKWEIVLVVGDQPNTDRNIFSSNNIKTIIPIVGRRYLEIQYKNKNTIETDLNTCKTFFGGGNFAVWVWLVTINIVGYYSPKLDYKPINLLFLTILKLSIITEGVRGTNNFKATKRFCIFVTRIVIKVSTLNED